MIIADIGEQNSQEDTTVVKFVYIGIWNHQNGSPMDCCILKKKRNYEENIL